MTTRAQRRRNKRALGQHRSPDKPGSRPPTRDAYLVHTSSKVLLPLPFGLFLGRRKQERLRVVDP